MEKIPILLILLGHIWVDASQGILPVILVKLKELFALTYFQAGLAMAVLNITSSVIQPVFGCISDRFYSGWFIPVGILWTALSMGLLGWAPSYQLSLILLGFAGLGTAAFHPRALMTVFLVSGSRRGFGVGLFSTGGNLGFALGPVVGGLLVFQLGFHATMGA
jgi:FSR family fosmidomycin resistance protein-like MFS transporter